MTYIYNYYIDTHNNFNFYGSYNIYIKCILGTIL